MDRSKLEELLALEIIRLSNASEELCLIPQDISLIMQAGRAFPASQLSEGHLEMDDKHYWLFVFSSYLEQARVQSPAYIPDAFLLKAIRSLSEDVTGTTKWALGYITPTLKNLSILNREAWLRGII